MDFVYEYLMFLAQAVTIVVAVLIVISSIASLGMKQAHVAEEGHLKVTKLNDRLRNLRFTMEDSLLTADEAKKQHKRETKEAAKAAKSEAKSKAKSAKHDGGERDGESSPRAYVARFEGDVRASAIDHLRLEISSILTMATPEDEVIVCVESPGGMVHSYGLAASQLMRVRSKGIPLTVAVDKVAASGGYMMAAVANKILAAPFALVGSIGVVAQVPNVHRLLKKNDVDVEVLTAGKYKRTLTTFGENTEEGREKFIEELEDIHALFQEFVAENRVDLDMDKIATGEAWYGKRALDLNLVDQLLTSDEYLMGLCEERDVYEVKWEEAKKPIDRLLGKVSGTFDRANNLMDSFWKR
jgi:serine protease SohB